MKTSADHKEQKGLSYICQKTYCELMRVEDFEALGPITSGIQLTQHFTKRTQCNSNNLGLPCCFRMTCCTWWIMNSENAKPYISALLTFFESLESKLIEILWHCLKQAVQAWKVSNVAELKWFCKEEGDKIPPQWKIHWQFSQKLDGISNKD